MSRRGPLWAQSLIEEHPSGTFGKRCLWSHASLLWLAFFVQTQFLLCLLVQPTGNQSQSQRTLCLIEEERIKIAGQSTSESNMTLNYQSEGPQQRCPFRNRSEKSGVHIKIPYSAFNFSLIFLLVQFKKLRFNSRK